MSANGECRFKEIRLRQFTCAQACAKLSDTRCSLNEPYIRYRHVRAERLWNSLHWQQSRYISTDWQYDVTADESASVNIAMLLRLLLLLLHCYSFRTSRGYMVPSFNSRITMIWYVTKYIDGISVIFIFNEYLYTFKNRQRIKNISCMFLADRTATQYDRLLA